MINSQNQTFPEPPLLCRQSKNLCKTCKSHTSLSFHTYCRICCANKELNSDDKKIRDDIMLYHLKTTYNNRRGINVFNKTPETDSNQIKRYIRVLSINDNLEFINYFNDSIISSKINNDYYFSNL